MLANSKDVLMSAFYAQSLMDTDPIFKFHTRKPNFLFVLNIHCLYVVPTLELMMTSTKYLTNIMC